MNGIDGCSEPAGEKCVHGKQFAKPQLCARQAVVIVAGVGPLCFDHANAERRASERAGEPYEARPILNTPGGQSDG